MIPSAMYLNAAFHGNSRQIPSVKQPNAWPISAASATVWNTRWRSVPDGNAIAMNAQNSDTSRQKRNHWNSDTPMFMLPGRRRYTMPTGPCLSFSCIAGSFIASGVHQGNAYWPGASGLPLRIAARISSSLENLRKSGACQNFNSMLIRALAMNTNTADRMVGNHSEASVMTDLLSGQCCGMTRMLGNAGSIFLGLWPARLGELLPDLRWHQIVVRPFHRLSPRRYCRGRSSEPKVRYHALAPSLAWPIPRNSGPSTVSMPPNTLPA